MDTTRGLTSGIPLGPPGRSDAKGDMPLITCTSPDARESQRPQLGIPLAGTMVTNCVVIDRRLRKINNRTRKSAVPPRIPMIASRRLFMTVAVVIIISIKTLSQPPPSNLCYMASEGKINTAGQKKKVREPRLGDHVLGRERPRNRSAPNTCKLNSTTNLASARAPADLEKPLGPPTTPPMPRSLAFALALPRVPAADLHVAAGVDPAGVRIVPFLDAVRVEEGSRAIRVVA